MNRNPQLDLLRGIAVLLVIAHHYPYYDLLHQIGWAGVDLFFVLSGFLISGLLFSDWKRYGRLSIGRFFVRRGLKIYPGFYVFLLITALPLIRMQGTRPFWNELLFLQDYLPHFWSHMVVSCRGAFLSTTSAHSPDSLENCGTGEDLFLLDTCTFDHSACRLSGFEVNT